jgi:hypothetical protein
MVWKGRKCWMAAAVAATLLVGSLGTAEAAGRRVRGETHFWAQLQVWLRAHVPVITALWGDEGTQIDPSGQPHAAAPPVSIPTDEGSIIDSSGWQ